MWNQFGQATDSDIFAVHSRLFFVGTYCCCCSWRKTWKRNEISLLPISFYYFKISLCIWRGGICAKRDATQGGLVNKGDRAWWWGSKKAILAWRNYWTVPNRQMANWGKFMLNRFPFACLFNPFADSVL